MRKSDFQFWYGINRMYNFIKRILDDSPEKLNEIYGTDDIKKIFNNNSSIQIIRKYSQYETNKKLEEFENERNGRN